MTRWHVVKGRKETEELYKRFTDIQFEIAVWKAAEGKWKWADKKNIQSVIDKTLFGWEFGEVK